MQSVGARHLITQLKVEFVVSAVAGIRAYGMRSQRTWIAMLVGDNNLPVIANGLRILRA